jgi:hypothetical protein
MTNLVIGNTDRSEFREARRALRAASPTIEVAGIDAACDILADETHVFDIIVVIEEYPGQYSAAAIDRVRELAPLARLVGLMGSWCEGEGRTGRPWPAAIRVYWHQWLPQFARESARLCTGAYGSWGLPVTAAEEERLLAVAQEPFPSRAGRIAVYSHEYAMQQWLCAACERAGYTSVWLRKGVALEAGPLAAAIFDGDDCRDAECDELSRLVAEVRPAPVVALLGFPRAADRDRAASAGAAAVLSKPVGLEDLYWQLDQVAPVSGVSA